MRLLLYSHVVHKLVNGQTYAYGPYVKEMNLWLREFDSVTIVAPSIKSNEIDPIEELFECNKIDQIKLISFSTTGISAILKSFISVPFNALLVFFSMFLPGHVHVRCPGNIGLLACFAQLFFPWKRKSFKYAGNWIENKGQPISYRIQKWIMANCFLTRKSTALVYGKKPSDSFCVTNAFTATYAEKDKLQVPIRSLSSNELINLVFAGALISGKNPLVAVETCRILNENGLNA
ncbi:MAG: glycosyltransferase family 1 protein, partial [Bacteroidota bacterium]